MLLTYPKREKTDVILDIVGGDYLARDMSCLAPDGRIACIASTRGRACEIDLAILLSRRATILGSSLRSRSDEQKAVIAHELRDRVWPLLPFERVAQAHARMESSLHVGKIVLVPSY